MSVEQQSRTVTQEEFRKILLESNEPFLVDPTKLSKGNLEVLVQEFSKEYPFPSIVLETSDYLIRRGEAPGAAYEAGYGHSARGYYMSYEGAAGFLLNVLPEKQMNTVTDREKLEHLLAGGVLGQQAVYSKLNSEGMLTFCTKEGEIKPETVKRTCIDFEESVIVKQWYDEIPEEGVLCFVWSGSMPDKAIKLIKDYQEEYQWKFITTHSEKYQYAVPLSAEQIDLYNQLMGTAHAV